MNKDQEREGRGKQMERDHENEDRHQCERGESIECREENKELSSEQNRELVRVYQNYLKIRRVPPKQIYNERKIGNKALRNVRFEHAVEYLTKKSNFNLTAKQKCNLWLQTGHIHNVPASMSSSTDTHHWTELQTQILKEATMHLQHNAKIAEIYGAVLASIKCQNYTITDIFTKQQIRDKFRNICKKRKSM